jgi:uncharacterized protein (DUF697 family)/predicted GTPase
MARGSARPKKRWQLQGMCIFASSDHDRLAEHLHKGITMWNDRLTQAWGVVKAVWNSDASPEGLEESLAQLRAQAPTPVFWMVGKTQSGKSSIIRHLTGAEDAAVGTGFRPCTKTSREYPFPTADATILRFLDTRGLDEPGYDATDDLAAFNDLAHVMIVTAKLTDMAQGTLRTALETYRKAKPNRPVVLVLTCLHEAYPQQQHPQPYPFATQFDTSPHADVNRLIAEQAKQFQGLFDVLVPIDLTKPDEGYHDPNYGGEHLKQSLLKVLPTAYRESLLRLTDLTVMLKDVHQRHARPIILSYTSLAATAGALPIPLIDLVLLPAIQTRMVYHLAKIYGQELSAVRFLELATTVGMGLLAKQAIRQVTKFIPVVGSVAGSALAAASTFALGRAFVFYYESVHSGHVPDSAKLRSFYDEQLKEAHKLWTTDAKSQR